MIDIAPIIEKKIETFFKSKISLKDRINTVEGLFLIIQLNNDQFRIALFKENRKLQDDINLGDILALNLIEKALTNEQKIKDLLITGFNKNEATVLQINSNKTYLAGNSNMSKEITINQILE